mmetsp:Transcript_52615/g.96313  ORF Transcript_52615/g.96313 Transcript_52615/m.96313 type:complete len:530 (-) Transcript_52615:127-1716(-)
MSYVRSTPLTTRRYLPDDVFIKNTLPPAEETTTLEKCAPFLCEFVGTFILALTIGYISPSGNPAWVPTVIGAVLMVLAYATGPVSGGYLNPAVSLALGFIGKLGWFKVFGYIVVQTVAVFLAALTMFSLFDVTVTIQPNPEFGMISAGFCEIFYTGLLCFVVLNCAASKTNNPRFHSNQFYGLAIGLAVIAGSYPCSAISGAVFNPAIAFGFSVIQMGSGLIYVAFHIVAAALAGMMFKSVRPDDYLHENDEAVAQFEDSIEAKCLSEFVGTLVLMITVGLNVLTHSEQIGWSTGAALACLIYSLGDVSGGHFNPAVSIAVWLSGRSKLSTTAAGLYIVMQVMGAVIAGFVLSYVHDQGPYDHEVYGVHPEAGTTWHQVVEAELVFTFVLCWVFLAVGTASLRYPGNTSLATPPPKRSAYAGLAIGLTLTVGAYAVGSITGAILNPAIAIGLQVEMASELSSTNTTKNFIENVTTLGLGEVTVTAETFTPDASNYLKYSLIELGAGVIAAAFYHCSHAHEFHAKNAAAN